MNRLIVKRMLIQIMSSGIATGHSKELPGSISTELIRNWDSIQEEMRKKIISYDTEPWALSSEDLR